MGGGFIAAVIEMCLTRLLNMPLVYGVFKVCSTVLML